MVTSNKINKTFSYLEQAHERPPSAEEIAEELDMTITEVKQSLKNAGRHVSMDAPFEEGESSNLYDVLQHGESPNPEKSLLHESLNTEIDRILNTLNDKEARVVRLFFGIDQKTPKSLDEIGQEFDLTRERVRQIREKALRKLKKHADNPLLKSFLG